MALDSSRFLVTQEIAVRSGVIESRYRIADGRFVLDNKDLSRIRFTTDEYINGLAGVEKVTDVVAQRLIAENGYQMGLPKDTDTANTAAVENENGNEQNEEE